MKNKLKKIFKKRSSSKKPAFHIRWNPYGIWLWIITLYILTFWLICPINIKFLSKYQSKNNSSETLSKKEIISQTLILNHKEPNKEAENRPKKLLSIGLLLFIYFIALGTFLYIYFPDIIYKANYFIILGFLSIFILLLIKLIIGYGLPEYLLPIPLGVILLSILLGGQVSIIAIFFWVLTGILITNNWPVTLVYIIVGLGASTGSSNIRNRMKLLKIGLNTAILGVAAVLFLGLFNGIRWENNLFNATMAGTSSLFCALFAAGILPFWEYIFKINTDVTLLELSDLNQPLLKRLIAEAPGTFQAGLVVGNLAEAAARAINANSLLARVGAYYHDIGKIGKSEYFMENQAKTKDNVHKKLSPYMSNLILISHIKEGVISAKKAKLPQALIDIIEQHHGTTLTSFFYQAVKKNGESAKIKEEDFRYPGPKPQTKEAAIVMLSDAAEAAARSLEDSNPARIQGVIKKIISDRFNSHQLDECPLTFKDLGKIEETLSKTLVSVFHTRDKYPG
jgi:putative nucleotidyltransferase with HDIG domain